MAGLKRNWVVSIATQENDPMIFGPYTEQRAKELAKKFTAWMERKGADWVEQNFEFLHASAIPIRNVGIREMTKEFS